MTQPNYVTLTLTSGLVFMPTSGKRPLFLSGILRFFGNLLKNFEFNYHVDTIDIISDKAILPRLPEWIHENDSKAFRTLYGRFPRSPPPLPKVWCGI